MSSFSLHISNRTETLLKNLIEIRKHPLSSPFVPDIIVIEGRGLENWLRREIAREIGIAANTRFLFPGTLMRELLQGVTGYSGPFPFDLDKLTFRIMRLLPEIFQGLESSAQHNKILENKGRDFYTLCHDIADSFDQYAIRAPTMIADWNQGEFEGTDEENIWQALLWQRLSVEDESLDPLYSVDLLMRYLKDKDKAASLLPERISCFGIAGLPELYRNIFEEISRTTEIHFFLLEPGPDGPNFLQHLNENDGPFLAYFSHLHAQSPEHFHLDNHFIRTRISGPLTYLQNIGIQDMATQDLKTEITTSSYRDNSIPPEIEDLQIHSCPTPLREIEILCDNLLAMFDAIPDLRADQIAILSPQPEVYGPLIQSVFHSGESGIPSLPLSPADVPSQREQRTFEAIKSILEIRRSRFAVPEILDLIELSAIRNRFGFSDSDFDILRTWIRSAGIRWGIDGEQRTALGLPAFTENSWETGLESIILGSMMDPAHGETFCNIRPGRGYEDVPLMDRLFACISGLKRARKILSEARSPASWSVELQKTFAELTDFGSEPDSILDNFLMRLQSLEDEGHYKDLIEPDALEAHILMGLRHRVMGRGFPGEGISFGAFLPMRTVPFRILCLVGMNEDIFPSNRKTPDFNLLQGEHKSGAAGGRGEDRRLFLETILSTREILYLSYQGRDMSRNIRLRPSPLVQDLIEAVRDSRSESGKSFDSHPTREHRLHAYDEVYFRSETKGDGSALFSYSKKNMLLCNLAHNRNADAQPFFPDETESKLHTNAEQKTDAPSQKEDITLEKMRFFFRNPCEYLLRNELGIILKESNKLMEAEESFSPAAFEQTGIRREIWNRMAIHGKIEESKLDPLHAELKQAGQIPPGTAGKYYFDKARNTVERLLTTYQKLKEGSLANDIESIVHIDGRKISARLEGVDDKGLIFCRPWRIRGRDMVDIGLQHLFFQSRPESGDKQTTRLIGLDPAREDQIAVYEFAASKTAAAVLADLLELFDSGMQFPLPFFSETSFAFAQSISDNADTARALKIAQKAWNDSFQWPGEKSNLYISLSYRGRSSPLDPESDEFPRFQELALRIYGPILSLLQSNSRDSILA